MCIEVEGVCYCFKSGEVRDFGAWPNGVGGFGGKDCDWLVRI